ncbi:hypothetical protein NDU88_000862 [Pleurodeles waltl]|uniref:Uncharacterized protein n=1 Tax=Pleurodeles waltl TaxID=8319 RepID=A0AAV7VYR7_PLEWA|nr:hypothetical protein NDU88_000862 [Pleurodeles waltl]
MQAANSLRFPKRVGHVTHDTYQRAFVYAHACQPPNSLTGLQIKRLTDARQDYVTRAALHRAPPPVLPWLPQSSATTPARKPPPAA